MIYFKRISDYKIKDSISKVKNLFFECNRSLNFGDLDSEIKFLYHQQGVIISFDYFQTKDYLNAFPVISGFDR